MTLLLAVAFILFLISGIIAFRSGNKPVGWLLFGLALLVMIASAALLSLFATSSM